MSADEDTELRDLVAQSLESNGVLGKIKAQLRASVFLALDEQESLHNQAPLQNAQLKKFLGTKDGRIVAGLVWEFLEFFNLDFTLSVFEPEICNGEFYTGRSGLARDLGISENESSGTQPLMAELLKHSSQDKGRGQQGEDLNPKLIADARNKFEKYDKDKNGMIDRDELRDLFCDIFPGFHKNLLDRYVNDEFRAADMDFSNGIDFNEFLTMYRRLFVQCRTIVSNDVTDIVSPRKAQNSPTRIPSPTRKLSSDLEFEEETTFSFSENNKNKKNSNPDSNKVTKRSTTNGKLNFSDPLESKDDDSFFDDPIPVNSEHSRSLSSDKSKDNKDKQSKPGGFLAGAPSLNTTEKKTKEVDFNSDFKYIDRNLADMGLDIPADDYDDDFENSNVSPIGQTPRSARSDHNIRSIEEDIDEEIEEDLSVAEDLLKSDNSGMEDLTTDRTVSPTEQSTAFDYVEEVHLP